MEAIQTNLFGEAVQAPVTEDGGAEVVAKLRAEMDANASNPYVQYIGQYLIKHVNTHPEHAGQLLDSEKTIFKSLEAMRKEAEKKKVGNVAVLTDAEGFAIVLEYFGVAPAKKGRAAHA